MRHILLVGNPNCGKTTLFNALTGDNQRVGNWPGVTVEKKMGEILAAGEVIQLTDLPGVYSLVANTQGLSQDEQIAVQSILTLESDCILNVVDACHLERHLYLTSQLLELGKPVILALNMTDIAQQRGIFINVAALEKQLGCPVISLQAHKSLGLPALLQTLKQPLNPTSALTLPLKKEMVSALLQLETQLLQEGYSSQTAYYLARRLAEDSFSGVNQTSPNLDLDMADARYQTIHQIVRAVQNKKSDASDHFTAKLDKIVLHRLFALPIFFAVMYLMFLFAINVGGAFQDFFDISTNTVFVQGTAWVLQQLHAPNWVIAMLANGLGKGINTTMTFVPVIATMFFFLSLLETSGYMARAAFVVDKAMRVLGLPGKSFVPMIVGFGCNVPAILAARTLDSERDRLLTVMMSPFMSCSARLAIYAVFVAAFFPKGGQNIVFSLYLFGILMAVLTGFILRKTTLKGHASPLILELPAYHKPALRRLCKETFMRLRLFVLRAGKLILPICILLGGLNAISWNGALHSDPAHPHSLLSILGQWITPLFAPMGISQDNWPATVGLLSGMLAKEVVVGTLNSLYSQVGHLGQATASSFHFWGGLQEALWSIPHNLAQLGSALWNPILAKTPEHTLSASVYGLMGQRFNGSIGAYAYMLFILLYIPCISTMAVIRQEANRFYMWTSILWSFILAYAAAVLFYQMAHFFDHPQQSLFWLMLISLILSTIIVFFYRTQNHSRRGHVIANT